MREKTLSPHASSLIQSMRDLGYSLETAIADLIDNSITAKSDNVKIFLKLNETERSCLAIIDNGSGMNDEQLMEAMRPGSRNPREKRSKHDLGRFGLGLKTASFSQCKSLTVVTRSNGITFAAQWDLDLINQRNEWVVLVPEIEEIKNLPFIGELGQHGTYILWQKLDRLLENSTFETVKNSTYDKLSDLEKHLSLVFHRYISGDYRKPKLNIFINDHAIAAFDPFCTSNRATQMLQEEIVRVDKKDIIIQPYILPHHSKLSKQEYDYYNSRSEFVSNQGVYVYRNGRLIIWGNWFKLVPKGEATKLARVKIDFPNSLDEHWSIDIKKSHAHPPLQVREKLKQIINRIAEQSTRVHKGRGNRLFDEQEHPLWKRNIHRQGIRYSLNQEHPLLMIVQNRLDEEGKAAFEDVLTVIGHSLPLEAIYADYSSSPHDFEEKEEIPYDAMKTKLQHLYLLFSGSGSLDHVSFSRIIMSLKPFSENPGITQKILKELI